MGLSKTPRLTLDRDDLVEIVSDPAFFVACPSFAWLQNAALQTKQLYDASGQRRCCGPDWKIIRPLIDEFFRALQETKAQNADDLAKVRLYLATKKGKNYGRITIYYRAGREQPHPYRFDF